MNTETVNSTQNVSAVSARLIPMLGQTQEGSGGFLDIISQILAAGFSQEGEVGTLFTADDESKDELNAKLAELLSTLQMSEMIQNSIDFSDDFQLSTENTELGSFTAASAIGSDTDSVSLISSLVQSNSGEELSKLLSAVTGQTEAFGGEQPDMSSVESLLKSADFSSLDNDQKTQLVKELINSGGLSVTKDNSFSEAIRTLAKDYSLAQSVQKAKQALSTTEKTDEEISEQSSLVFDYRAGETVSADYSSESVAGAEEESAVFAQTLDSLEKAIGEKAESFTAKLNPEGLGEIVVKMEKSDEGLLIKIAAAGEKTAQLLNNRLAELQTSLGSYNARVEPATVMQTEQTSSYGGYAFERNDGSDRRFNGGEEQRRQRGARDLTAQKLTEETELPAEATAGQINIYA